MKITTWNVNGLRAAIRKGISEYLAALAPDVLLMQEIRVKPDDLTAEWRQPGGWRTHWHPAERPGYSGTATWSKSSLKFVGSGLNGADPEGRVIQTEIDGVLIINIYLPSGSSSPERQQEKEKWMAVFMPWAVKLAQRDTPVIMGGDFNIAHTEKDIFHAKSNEKTSGFLPHEREWMGRLLNSGWHDFVREHFGDRHGPYSWWSNRGQARALDRGWRIDYLIGNAAAARGFRSADIHRAGGLAISDHAPVSIVLDL